MKVVALMSGGPDSATLAAFLKAKGREILPMNVYYGQRNRREMEAFEEIRKVLGLPEARVVCLDNIFSLLKSQAECCYPKRVQRNFCRRRIL